MAEEIKHFVSNNSGTKGLSKTIPVKKSSSKGNRPLPTSISKEPIDLRELFPEHCYPHRQGKIIHYMDEAATKLYLLLLDNNEQKYTQAIYDAVIKDAGARMAQELFPDNSQPSQDTPATEEDEITFKPPTIIPVGYSQHRQEYRLNFTTDIEIELPSGSLIQGRSVDISPSGMQIKLNFLLDAIDEMVINISFPVLEEKYEQNFGQVPYKIMKSTVGSMFMSIMLARVEPGEHPFDVFLQDFIEQKKHRYKIDAEDSKLALTSKAWEYLYINSLPYIACFVETRGERIKIQEITVSPQNKHQLKGLGNSMLSLVEQQMSSFRLNGIAHKDSSPPEVYAFRNQGKGSRRRLCATSWQFSETQAKTAFLKAGIHESSFVAWQISVIKLDKVSQQRSHELIQKLKQENPKQATALVDQLNRYEYLFYLVDITENLRRDPLFKYGESEDAAEDCFFDSYEVKRRRPTEYSQLRLGTHKQRSEDRYIYQSPILLKYYGEKFQGHTMDLSVNGLKVKLGKNISLQNRDTVTIDFVGLNKKFRSSKLKSQSYRIAAKTTDGYLCLTRDHRIARHDAAIFMSKLLNKNKTVLPACTGELWMSTKLRLMESWLHLCLPSQSVLITREKKSYSVPYILSGNFTSQILSPFSIGKDIYDFESLVQLPSLPERIRELRMNIGYPSSFEIYLTQQPATEESKRPVIEIKTQDDFKDDIEKVEYIQRCSRTAIFGFYQLTLCNVPRLEKSDLLDDMNIIRRNAPHRLAEFDKELQSLVAVAELTECTDLILDRHNLKRA